MAAKSGRARRARSKPSPARGTRPAPESAGIEPRLAPAAVVLLTYGPRRTTRDARRRLNAMLGSGHDGGQVPVVEFSPLNAHLDGLPAGASLTRVLEGCPPGPVLLLHDDVNIRPRGVERLVRAHLEGVGVAVPVTNDRGCDHFGGPLPPVARADADLDALDSDPPGGGEGPQPVSTIRPACLVADRDTLVDLARRRIHDPLTRLTDRGAGFAMVPGAHVAHDGSCSRQMPSPVLESEPPLLVAAMIVRDEEDMLPGCLDSLRGLVDRIEILDTGSRDATVDIALARGASVNRAPWRDDFSQARNEVLEQCRDAAFVLWIDADERVRCPDPELLRRSLASFPGDIEALDVRMRNIVDPAAGTVSSTFTSARIVRADLLAFEGTIHEQPVRRQDPRQGLETVPTGLISLDHLGYQDEVVDVRDKRTRNLELARSQYRSERSPKAALDYARSLMLAGEAPDEAVDLLREAVAAARGTRIDWHAYLQGSLAHLLLERGDEAGVRESHTLARAAFEAVPRDDLAAAVFARTATELDLTSEFIDSARTRASADVHLEGPEPVFTSPDNRDLFRRLLLEALVTEGHPSDAWTLVDTWWGPEASPDRGIDGEMWPTVAATAVSAKGPEDGTAALVDLAAGLGTAHGLTTALASLVPPVLTAVAAASLLSVGVRADDAASTGLIAAVVGGEWALFDVMAPQAASLDPVVRSRLAARLDGAGEHQRAAALTGSTSGGSGGGLLGLAGLAGVGGSGGPQSGS